MKTVCIYHSIDLDGWMSATIVKHWHTLEVTKRTIVRKEDMSLFHTIDFIGYNYGQPIPNLSSYDKVIMCDISFPKKEMCELHFRLQNNFIWLDHHISAIKENNETITGDDFEGIRDTKFAACELTWKYFFPNEEMPEIVRLLGRYDCFGHKGTDEEQKVLEFQYGARQRISNYEQAYEYLTDMLDRSKGIDKNDFRIIQIYKEGTAIYQYLCTEAKQVYKNGFEIWFDDEVQSSAGNSYKFICINKERFNPINFGIDYHKEGYDGAVCFHYANDMWNFSLYNDNGLVDCSIIAKQFGGGGHKGASGFRIKDITQIIK